MKILVPLNERTKINKFGQSGADELYFGFYDEEWTRIFGKYSDINRMSGFGKSANKYSIEEVPEIVSEIKTSNMASFITMNANTYSNKQIDFIENKYIPMLVKSKIDGVIVSDIRLAKMFDSYGVRVVASTMLGVYNTDIVNSLCKFGIKRMILPREISIDEMKSIILESPKIEFEVFFMRNGCVFSDCYCLGTHRSECGSTCGSLKKLHKQILSSSKTFEARHEIELNDMIYHKYFHNEACAMCALYQVIEMGVSSLKIVGRADDADSVFRDIELTRHNIEIATKCTSEKEFLSKMIFPDNSYYRCKLGLSCYYPEIRF